MAGTVVYGLMMQKLFVISFALLILLSCTKAKEDTPTCYEGRFLNDIGCYDLVAIQVTGPPFLYIDASYKAADGKNYSDGIALVLPAEYKDGQPFYFTLDSIYRRPVLPANCFYVPRYFGRPGSISKIKCT